MTLFLAALTAITATGWCTSHRVSVRRAEIIHWTRQHLARYEQAIDAYEDKTERYKRLCGRWQRLHANGARIP